MEVEKEKKVKATKKGEKGNADGTAIVSAAGEIGGRGMEVDYTATCEEAIPRYKAVGKGGNISQALTDLLALEKQTRTGGDMISTGKVLIAIAEICYEAKDWALLKEHLLLLTKRRGQLKEAVVKLIQEVATYVDNLPTKELQYDLLDTLRTVTEGKIYVEVERARLTLKLARMKEAEGKIVEAANILQELQVETYGSMDKKEKVELILEQMRYCLAKNDCIRTQIISKKISTKFFDDESTQDLKIKYYTLMIEMDEHDGSYLSICRHYRAIMATPKIQDDKEREKDILRHVVIYLVLSPYNNEQVDLLHRLLEEKSISTIPVYKTLLEVFKNQELINWKELSEVIESEMKGSGLIFDETTFGENRWKTLKSRVVEHNIRMMGKYYTRIHLSRMSELLDLDKDEVEKTLCEMVVGGSVVGKVDRPAGIVYFQDTKDPSERLNDWTNDVNKLMALVARTTHLINKEEMVQKHLFNRTSVDTLKPMETN